MNPSANDPINTSSVFPDPQGNMQNDSNATAPSTPPLNEPANLVPNGNGQPLPAIPPPIASNDATPPTSIVPVPQEAQDSDLIEQEWVDKAKAIVEHTKDNPYEQNKQINQFKADYIKKRYNRQIKVKEE